jgi:hypothetical protein
MSVNAVFAHGNPVLYAHVNDHAHTQLTIINRRQQRVTISQ